MRIRYENTREDWVAFGNYVLTHSAAGKRSMARMRWLTPACFFILGGTLFESADLKFNFVAAVILSAFGFVAMPSLDSCTHHKGSAQIYYGERSERSCG